MIKGLDITLRNVLETDLAELYLNTVDLNDAGEFMPVSLVSFPEFKKSYEANGFWGDDFGKLLIINEVQDCVGEIGFFKTTHYINGVEIYFRLYSSVVRNKGIMTDALKLFIKFLFQSQAYSRIQAVTTLENYSSQAVLKKNSFVFEGTLRKARILHGETIDLQMYSITRNDWNELK